MVEQLEIEWRPGETITALVYRDTSPLLVLAHGAGTNQTHPAMVGVATALANAGHGVMTFNYPYTEAGRRGPDRAPKLLECHLAVVEAARALTREPPMIGGRSMGGRMATMLAAEGADVRGVVCLAYPLHPAGKPDRLRIDHLPSIDAPLLFFQGSRDSLSRAELFDIHVRPLSRATIVDMEGADHSFRGKGWTAERVADLVVDEYGAWLREIG